MSYFPTMAYHMVSLEPPLKPPTAVSGLGDLTDILNSFSAGVSDLVGGIVQGTTAVTQAVVAGQNASYCSPANPQPGCTAIAGVCLPVNGTVLEIFKNLQRQANRVADKEGRDLIDVDGRIGPSTVAAVAAALGSASATSTAYTTLSPASIQGKPCDVTAAHASELAAAIKAYADAVSAPTPDDPATSVPSVATATGVAHPPADVINKSADTAGGLFDWIPAEVKTPLGIALLAFGGYAVWQAWKGGPKKKGSGRTRRRPTSRARNRRTRRRGR